MLCNCTVAVFVLRATSVQLFQLRSPALADLMTRPLESAGDRILQSPRSLQPLRDLQDGEAEGRSTPHARARPRSALRGGLGTGSGAKPAAGDRTVAPIHHLIRRPETSSC